MFCCTRVISYLSVESGHILNLLLTELRPGYKARIQTPYIDTTNKCFSLFFWLQVGDLMNSESATLSVILITEAQEEILVTYRKTGPNDWCRLFIELPGGLHRIVVEGKRGVFGSSGVSLDDISLKDCDVFCKFSPQQFNLISK